MAAGAAGGGGRVGDDPGAQAIDAASLVARIGTPEVSRYIPPGPTSVDGCERFVAWTLAAAGSGRQLATVS